MPTANEITAHIREYEHVLTVPGLDPSTTDALSQDLMDSMTELARLEPDLRQPPPLELPVSDTSPVECSEGVGPSPAIEGGGLRDFLADRCIEVPEASVTNPEIWQAYQGWCDSQGVQDRLGRKGFTQQLASLGFSPSRTGKARLWRGIGLVG